ncbi:MAG: hypothetical protein RMY28_021635 [Nostoc sp. ChiSLP01]|nr:hypothetical protein [Nostoc sp. CmiSLP01]MDZ8282715.1 hypothetical protein [Nostoc sp. ChiSLP01]
MKNFVTNDSGVLGLTRENKTIENTLMENFQPESKVKKIFAYYHPNHLGYS